MESYKNFSRRDVLKAAGAAGAGGLAGCLDGNGNTGNQPDVGDRQTLRIGVIEPFSGLLSYWGDIRMWGLLSGLAYKYDKQPPAEYEAGDTLTFVGDDDTAYELVLRDGAYDSAEGRQAAVELVQDEEVDMLVGVGNSEGVIRVIETVVSQAQVPFMSGFASSTEFTTQSDLCHDLVFHPAENVAMEASATSRYVAEETEDESIFLLGPQGSFGSAFVREYEKNMRANGIEVVGTRQVPEGFSEFGGILDNAADSGADALGVTFTAQALVNFVPAHARGNLSGEFDLQLYAGFPGAFAQRILANTLEGVVGEISEESLDSVQIGPQTCRYFWNQYDNPINNAFTEMCVNTYGHLPDFFSGAAFTTSSAIVQAVESLGSVDPMDIADELHGMTVQDTPKGENAYKFQEYNHKARSPMTMANDIPTQVDNWDSPIQPTESLLTLGRDETTMPEDDPDMGCDLS